MSSKNKFLLGFSLFLSIFLHACGGGTSQKSETAKEIGKGDIVFQNQMHDFGAVKRGEEVGAIFGFVNEGDAPVIIQRVAAGCGCTAVNYTKTPIPPSEKGFVEVIFDARGQQGFQRKTVRVYANIPEESILLTITALVE